LKGTHARDKDAAVGALLFAELAAALKDRRQTVLEYLDDLYIDVGHHEERQLNKTCEGREGIAQINSLMNALRGHPPRQVGGLTLAHVHDYQKHEVRRLDRQEKPQALERPRGDLLIFHTDRASTGFAARPSGTEPKIKFYLFARTPVSSPDRLSDAKAETGRYLDQMTLDLEAYVDGVLNPPTTP
jgi:phosphoglucomutase/phosphomannomutase